jgi:RES domain-containing protein
LPLDLAPLREIPVRRTALTVYFRQVWLPDDGSLPDPFIMRREGRWATNWTLYTATTPAVAWAEYCRNHPRDVAAADLTGGVGLDDAALAALGPLELAVPARALFELDFAFDRLADLTSAWAIELLARAGFQTTSFSADPPSYGDCPELASLVADLGWQAMLVPSAAWRWSDGLCVPVFEAGASALAGHRMTLAAAKPSVAVAAATTYPRGARPRWLA